MIRKISKGTNINVVSAEGDWLRLQSKFGDPPGVRNKCFTRIRSASAIESHALEKPPDLLLSFAQFLRAARCVGYRLHDRAAKSPVL